MRTRSLPLAGLMVLALAGCTSSGTTPGLAPERTARSTVAPVVVADAPTMKEGRDYDVVADLPATIDGVDVHLHGTTPDGMVTGDTAEPTGADAGSMALETYSRAILLDLGTGKVTKMSNG